MIGNLNLKKKKLSLEKLGRKSKMKIKDINKHIQKTLGYISYCHKSKIIKPPVILKGIIGELLAIKFLIKYFGEDKIKYYGGRKKGFDIEINNLKIEVKASHAVWREKKIKFINFESSPDTLTPKTFKETDFIIWVIIYLNKKWNRLRKYNIYIFDSKQGRKYFKRTGWYRKRKGKRFQIIRIFKIKKIPKDFELKKSERKELKRILKYNTPQHKKLFLNSMGEKGIQKIRARLKSER